VATTYSQVIAKAFADAGITDAFVVTGGAIAPFTSALAEQGRVKMHFMLNEQAAGVAAEAYGFYDGKPCLLIVTSGPGVTNCLTAIAAAYTNSSPVIVVSGQARVQDIKFAETHQLRQVGNQHLLTRHLVSTITKAFYEPTEQLEPFDLVEDLIKVATSPRMGPSWLSLPIDLQRELFNSRVLNTFKTKFKNVPEKDVWDFDLFCTLLDQSKRPALLIGNGAREAITNLRSFASRLSIPILTTWPGLDLVEESDRLYVGRPGSLPSSWLPNMVNYHSDFLIIVGARLDLAQVGYNIEDFAKDSIVWRVDVDDQELKRFVYPNWNNIHTTAYKFSKHLEEAPNPDESKYRDWWRKIDEWRKQDKPPSSVVQEFSDGVSTYRIIEFLSRELNPKTVVTGSSGTCMEMLLQTWASRSGQRVINSCGLGSMGFAIPAAIGISRKVMNEEVFCIESDGSFAMSLQELNTVIKQRLNVKIIILDSQGYKSIFLSQIRTGQFLHGFDSGTGLSLPALSAVAKTHEIRFRSIDDVNNLDSDTVQFLRQTGPCILQVKVSAQENALPRLLSVLQADGSLKAPRLIDLNPSL